MVLVVSRGLVVEHGDTRLTSPYLVAVAYTRGMQRKLAFVPVTYRTVRTTVVRVAVMGARGTCGCGLFQRLVRRCYAVLLPWYGTGWPFACAAASSRCVVEEEGDGPYVTVLLLRLPRYGACMSYGIYVISTRGKNSQNWAAPRNEVCRDIHLLFCKALLVGGCVVVPGTVYRARLADIFRRGNVYDG